VARPLRDGNATGKRKLADKSQRSKAGTKIGPLPKEKVMAALRKFMRGNRDWYAHGKDYD
jgi:hypothetical protein